MMTIDDAIKILNEHRHRYADGSESGWYRRDPFIEGPDRYDALSFFEAIAIAEKYQREADEDTEDQ
jgi:hypothetical protein